MACVLPSIIKGLKAMLKAMLIVIMSDQCEQHCVSLTRY